MDKNLKRYAIWNMKCARCHEGDLFETPTWSFRNSFEMPKSCPVCGQKYVIETGFYWGAMYVAYAISGFFMFLIFGISFFLLGFGVNTSFALALIVLAILYVWIFRMARSVWINLFVKYQPNWRKNAKLS